MKSIRTVNMVWERRFRGTYPPSRFALDDAGVLTLAIPRPLEARAYDLTRLNPEGGTEIIGGFAVETLLKLEVTATQNHALGMTSDDVYLFLAGNKSRFLGERRVTFIDAVLSADGHRVAAGFSDIAGASFALAYGESHGRVIWTRDVDTAITTLAIPRDGSHIAMGAENGTIWLIDATRRDIWEFAQGEAVRALACSQDGAFTAYGTPSGTIGLIDSEGARLWKAEVTGEVVAITLSGDGSVCAVLSRGRDAGAGTRLTCIDISGHIGWEYDAEKRLLGLALSSEGRFLATGGRDGTITVYAVVPGEALAGAPLPGPGLSRDDLATSGHDHFETVRTLRQALEAAPTDIALYEQFEQAHTTWFAKAIAEAQTNLNVGNYTDAAALLDMLLLEEPWHPELVALRNQAREAQCRALLQQAQQCAEAADYTGAEAGFRAAIAANPRLREARSALADLYARRTTELDAEADRWMAQGNLEAGLAALERAQSIAPTAERAARRNLAQTALEFSEGMAHYNEKRYREAIFQFKKVMARDPGHSDARRYLGFAQKFLQDSSGDSLSDRFSRLE